MFGVAVIEQKVNSSKDEAQEAIYLYDRIDHDNVNAEMVWEFSRGFGNLRDIEIALGIDPRRLQVAETNYFWTRNLALTFARNGAFGLTNFALGSKTQRTNIVDSLEASSVEAFNKAYKMNLLQLVDRENDLIRRWRESSRQSDKMLFLRNVVFFSGNLFGLAALLFAFRAIEFDD